MVLVFRIERDRGIETQMKKESGEKKTECEADRAIVSQRESWQKEEVRDRGRSREAYSHSANTCLSVLLCVCLSVGEDT